jgi:transposase
MSLKPQPIPPVPAVTVAIARAAFPKGTPYLTLRDELGTCFRDEDFGDLFPRAGQPSLSPWRLALVSILQFRENLSDRQAAEAVRARIDWKYLLGLELSDPGFDFSVLSEFRTRLLAGQAEERLLTVLLEQCRSRGLVKAHGRQRTDSTHVLASVRELNRLELIGETLRAALNEIATVEPRWLQGVAPPVWYERYSHRIEDSRLPGTPAKRHAYAQTIGEDGVALLQLVDALAAPASLKHLPKVRALGTAWARHFVYLPPPAAEERPGVRFKTNGELAQAEELIESPYDPEARYRSKSGLHWTGYMVHFSETCDDERVSLITHVHTTTADVHEAMGTDPIHRALSDKHLSPKEHLADAGYISAELLIRSQAEYGIELIGPPRENPTWQSKVVGAYTSDQFQINWEQRVVHCPQGVSSTRWRDYVDAHGKPYHLISFPKSSCQACSQRALCTKAKHQPRCLYLHPRPQQEALQAARARLQSTAGYERYAPRAGIEGTLSQGVKGG